MDTVNTFSPSSPDRTRLPAVRRAPIEELAAAAGASRIIQLGTGSARDHQELHRFWTIARELDWLVVSGTSATAGPASVIWREAGMTVPEVWLHPHPELLEVLDAIGSGHPKGRVRKAAKKAAHKARIARSG